MSKIKRTIKPASELIKLKQKFSLPDCQRNLDNSQVNKMLVYQTNYFNSYGEYFFPTPIVIGSLDNKFYIIDGQHRYECINILFKDENDFSVPVTIINIISMTELDEIYSIINSNKPVPIINDFQEWKGFTKYIEKEILGSCINYLSNSNRPHVPNINCNTLVTYLNENNIGEQINFNYKLFIDEIWKLNNYIAKTYDTSISKYFKQKNLKNQIDKCRSKNMNNPFFLGIYKNFEWIDFIVKSINNNIEYNNMNLTPQTYRVPIKRAVRMSVWKKRHTGISGSCYVCNDDLIYDNFECGHIVSIFNKGSTDVSNLEPICSSCNLNMGIQNLQEYKRQLQKELM